ncbi:hypothetical protein [Saccharomonospora iraqiensis]|uniref:hypothetical protein n=1 Tax=Saccharomonospora iraqiensis TaxID=52698 RepID=UPI0012B56D5A|nr:hypothetical protein [Saccharomonospora iraqiensis]
MEALTEPFLTYERALLYGSTDQLPAVVEHDRQWPTVDLDDPGVKGERERAVDAAIQRAHPTRAPQRQRRR